MHPSLCQKCFTTSVFVEQNVYFLSSSVASPHYCSGAGQLAAPVAFIYTHAGRPVLQSGLKWAHRRISGYCAGVLLGRLWIHLDFISELFWFPGVDNPGPNPPKRDWGRENDVISSLKSYSCSLVVITPCPLAGQGKSLNAGDSTCPSETARLSLSNSMLQ